MPTTKTWLDKLNAPKQPKVKKIETDFADIPAGSQMLVATPQLIDEYIRHIPKGKLVDPKTLRKDLALEHHADHTCPVSTGIFLRIVAEANLEKIQQGTALKSVTPFWRVIHPDSALAAKLSCGKTFLQQQLDREKAH